MKEITKEKGSRSLRILPVDGEDECYVFCPLSRCPCVTNCAFYDEKRMGEDVFAICGYGEQHHFSRTEGVDVTKIFKVIGIIGKIKNC